MNSIDNFHREIINSLLTQIPADIEYDIWYGTSAGILTDLTQLSINSKNFIIVAFDILERNEFDHTVESTTQFSQKFLHMVEQHPDTKFILICQVENAHSELKHPRVQIVRSGTGMCREDLAYQDLTPQVEKNFASNKNFICLNRSPRQHRINLVSYLVGLDLENHGTISFDKKHAWGSSWLDRVSWNLTDLQIETVKPVLMQGYEKLKTLDLQNSLSEADTIYAQNLNSAKNFDLYLRPMYQDHFVEIVPETQFNVTFFGASEKFKNSVYGCNFPIVVGGYGLVEFLRDLGVDMFDDVVDHSYDRIRDPLDRMCAAINLNQRLLTDNNFVKQQWNNNYDRFLKNIEFIKTDLFDIIKQRAYNDFKTVTWNH
jgi:hypothetical protein